MAHRASRIHLSMKVGFWIRQGSQYAPQSWPHQPVHEGGGQGAGAGACRLAPWSRAQHGWQAVQQKTIMGLLQGPHWGAHQFVPQGAFSMWSCQAELSWGVTVTEAESLLPVQHNLRQRLAVDCVCAVTLRSHCV